MRHSREGAQLSRHSHHHLHLHHHLLLDLLLDLHPHLLSLPCSSFHCAVLNTATTWNKRSSSAFVRPRDLHSSLDALQALVAKIRGTVDTEMQSMSREPVRLGIIGVGNCASSLVQGLSYYKHAAK